MRTTLSLAVALALSAAAAPAHAADDWAEFRGPNGTGHSDSTGLPLRWSETDNVRWKVPVHDKGWSSPVVWGDQVWLTTATEDGKALFGMCIDRDTGKVVHDLKLFTVAKPQFCIPFNSYASPTPAIEAGRVYLHFGSAGTACLDTATGSVVWERRDLPCDHFRGPGSSPIIVDGLLILTFDGADFQYVVALDKRTGKTVWRRDRDVDFGTKDGDAKKAYCTPALADVDGRKQLICPGAMMTMALDPKTGEELWRVIQGGMNVATRPLVGNGNVYLTTGSGGLQLLAVKPTGTGNVTKTHISWTSAKGVPSRPSPLLLGDLLFLFSDAGVISCLDANTGKQLWSERAGPRAKFTASPVVADGRIYCPDQDSGVTYVLGTGRAYELLASNKLADGCMASPAVAGKALYLRTRTHLYRLEKP